MRAAALAGLFLIPQAALSGPPDLYLPIDCRLGETCHIQNYVDADPTPGARDHACGALTYDGHKGTDFAVATHRDALRGVAVHAAAAGQVTGLRDGVADAFDGADAAYPAGQDCGNGVIIAHGQGWVTQYCHLARGSVAVKTGDEVEPGTVLGRVGMSGRTEFPHLHFSVRRDEVVVDPFDLSPDGSCGAPDTRQLWKDPLTYEPGGLLQAGFSPGVPSFDLVKFGRAAQPEIAAAEGALVLWGHVFGTREGDSLRMRIDGPDGVFFRHEVAFEKNQAQAYRAAGRRFEQGDIAPGRYTGAVILLRDGEVIGRMKARTILEE